MTRFRLSLAIFCITASLGSSCSRMSEEVIAIQQTEPAPIPVYTAGDTYVFDDNGRTIAETVVLATKDQVEWTNDSGVFWTSPPNPFLEPSKYSAHEGALKIERTHSKAANEFFPLMAGKRISYSVSERILGNDAYTNHDHECEVASLRTTQVRAGSFPAYEVRCETKKGLETFYYAPAIRHVVLSASGTFLTKKTKELISFKAGVSKAAASREAQPSALPPEMTKTGPGFVAPGPEGQEQQNAGAPPEISSFQRDKRQAKRATSPKTYGVQLGAFISSANAKAAWRNYLKEKPKYLLNVHAHYQEYLPPGGNQKLTRLVAGEFGNMKDAKRFCAKLRKGGIKCLAMAND